MTRGRFLFWQSLVLSATGGFAVGIDLFWVELAIPAGTNGHSSVLTILILFWFLLFPMSRLCQRRRIQRRGRSLRWADCPGGLVLISIIALCILGMMHLFLGRAQAIASLAIIGRYEAAVVIFSPAALGLLMFVAIIVDCLCPDRVVDDPNVFQ